ncbi:MAG: YceI family protein [Ignavibacteria bacterium]|jgi:polyisoprenoid-binding protein YceI
MKALLILAGILIFSSSVNATQLGNVKGKKVVTLQNLVGTSIAKFNSNSPLEKFEGNSQALQGSFTLNADNLEQSIGKISFPVRSMKTGLSKRDDHMYGKDWLDAQNHPNIEFELKKLSSISIKKSDNSGIEFTAIAEGMCSIKGTAKPAKAKLIVKYVLESETSRKRAQGDLVMIDADFSVSLKDYNVLGRGDIIGSKVGESIDLDIKLFGSTSN